LNNPRFAIEFRRVGCAVRHATRHVASCGARATGPAALDINGERDLRDADPI
jgi:hypothetical protein